MKQVTPSGLAGEIAAEIDMAAIHGAIEGFEFIDTDKIREMAETHYDAIGHVMQLAMAVLDRHVGKVIAADEGSEPRPLPYRFPKEEEI